MCHKRTGWIKVTFAVHMNYLSCHGDQVADPLGIYMGLGVKALGMSHRLFQNDSMYFHRGSISFYTN